MKVFPQGEECVISKMDENNNVIELGRKISEKWGKEARKREGWEKGDER